MERVFGLRDYVVDPNDHSISRNGRIKRVEPKLMAVLCVLASRQGEVVLRDDLKTVVWRDMVVGDDAVNRAIFALRNALGDDAKAPLYIETIPKKGYKLCCEVTFAQPLVIAEPIASNQGLNNESKNDAVLKLGQDGALRSLVRLSNTGFLMLGLFIVMLMVAFFALKNTFYDVKAAPKQAGISSFEMGKMTPLTHKAGSEKHIALNPVSEDYAYIHDVGERTDVYVYRVEEGVDERITDNFEIAGFPFWLDEHRLLFSQCHTWRCSLYIYQRGQPLQKVYNGTTRITGLAMSAQRSDVVYLSEPFDKERIVIKRFNIKTGEVVFLHSLYAQLPLKASVLSYQVATEALLLKGEKSAMEVPFILDLTSGNIRSLSLAFDEINDAQVMPSGEVLVAGCYEGVNGVWRILLNSLEPELLIRSSSTEAMVSLALDTENNALYYGTFQNNLDLKYFDHISKTVDSLPELNTRMDEDDGVLSADGSVIYFISNRTGAKELWQYRFETQKSQQITHLNARVLGRPAVSFDDRLVAVGYESDHRGMAVIDLESGDVIAQQEVGVYQYPLAWSKDGQYFYASEYSAGFRVHRYDHNTLDYSHVYEGAWLAASENNDRVIFAVSGSDKLKTGLLKEGEQQWSNVVIPNFDEISLGQLTLTDDYALTLGFDGAARRVIKYPYASETEPHTVLNLPPWMWVSDIRQDGLAVILEKHEMPQGGLMKLELD